MSRHIDLLDWYSSFPMVYIYNDESSGGLAYGKSLGNWYPTEISATGYDPLLARPDNDIHLLYGMSVNASGAPSVRSFFNEVEITWDIVFSGVRPARGEAEPAPPSPVWDPISV
jgi:hypothetical protein